jgi:rhodanese-related sulfurtransferase
MKSITLTTLILLNVLFIGCSPKAQTSEATKTSSSTVQANPIVLTNPADFKKQIEAGEVQLVDIRTPREFNQGHMKGALNYDYYKPEFMQQMNTLDKSKPVYIYCRSGNRTGNASKKLKRAGFTKIYDLKGGINYWLSKGYKLIR